MGSKMFRIVINVQTKTEYTLHRVEPETYAELLLNHEGEAPYYAQLGNGDVVALWEDEFEFIRDPELVGSKRKPYNHLAGYVASRKSKHPTGGHFVIYDRSKGFDCDTDERWIVQHEPSGRHVAVRTKDIATDIMKSMAGGYGDVDLYPVNMEADDAS